MAEGWRPVAPALPPWVRRIAGRVATGVAVTLAIVLATTLSGASAAAGLGRVTAALTVIGFVAVFPLHAVTVLTAIREQGPSPRRAMRFPIPVRGWRLVATAVLGLGAWCGLVFGTVTSPSGQPVRRDGAYYLNNHGDLTAISRDEWLRADQAWVSHFALGAFAFAAIAALYLTQAPLTPRAASAEPARRGGPPA